MSDEPEAAPRRGRPRSLTDEQIVAAAVGLLASGDPGNLTMRRLSAALGVGVMSLYRYFPSRESLEDAIVAHVLPDGSGQIDPAVPWPDELRTFMLSIYTSFQAHPGVAELFASRPTPSLAMDRVRNHALAIIDRSGLSPEHVVHVSGAVGRYVIGCAVGSNAQRAAVDLEGAERMRRLPPEFSMLRKYADAYPAHVAPDAVRFGLDLIIRAAQELAETG